MNTKCIPFLATLILALVPALRAADRAQVEARYLSYHAAGKAVVEMAISRRVDAAEVEKKVEIMVGDAVWLATEYAKAFPNGATLLRTVTEHVGDMRKLSFHELEAEWHDLGYFGKPGHEAGLDVKAEANEHFTDPIHAIVHPLLVLKAAQAYATGKKDEDLKAMKAEMEEGLEQAEKQKNTLLKS
jgi:hypothetical protein